MSNDVPMVFTPPPNHQKIERAFIAHMLPPFGHMHAGQLFHPAQAYHSAPEPAIEERLRAALRNGEDCLKRDLAAPHGFVGLWMCRVQWDSRASEESTNHGGWGGGRGGGGSPPSPQPP